MPATGLGRLLPLVSPSQAAIAANVNNVALQKVAKSTGILITRLSVATSAQVQYPLQNQTVTQIKVIDTKSGKIYAIALDGNGRELNTAKLQASEQSAQLARYGKLAPGLAEKLATVPGNGEKVRVMLWLKEPNSAPQPRPAANANDRSPASAQSLNSGFQQVDERRAAAIKPLVTAATGKLKNLGFQVKADHPQKLPNYLLL